MVGSGALIPPGNINWGNTPMCCCKSSDVHQLARVQCTGCNWSLIGRLEVDNEINITMSVRIYCTYAARTVER